MTSTRRTLNQMVRITGTKTLTQVTTQDGRSFNLIKHRNGWPIPRDESGCQGWVDGTGAYREACQRWIETGASVKRIPNPHYQPRYRLLPFRFG